MGLLLSHESRIDKETAIAKDNILPSVNLIQQQSSTQNSNDSPQYQNNQPLGKAVDFKK